MPNHVTNHVLIVADNIKRIERLLADYFIQPGARLPHRYENDETNNQAFPVLCFELIIPPPADVERGPCKGSPHPDGVTCWVKWNRPNWGTKWDAYSHGRFRRIAVVNNGGLNPALYLTFDTAWSQPTPILAALDAVEGIEVHAISYDEDRTAKPDFGAPDLYMDRVSDVDIFSSRRTSDA